MGAAAASGAFVDRYQPGHSGQAYVDGIGLVLAACVGDSGGAIITGLRGAAAAAATPALAPGQRILEVNGVVRRPIRDHFPRHTITTPPPPPPPALFLSLSPRSASPQCCTV